VGIGQVTKRYTATFQFFVDTQDRPSAAQREVGNLNKDLPTFDVKTMEQRVLDSLAPRRFALALLTIFSGVALFLAAIGIYGVMSQSVVQRTREIGIRMALGAGAGDVMRMVVGQGMLITACGLIAGLVASLAVTGLMEKLLFGVKPSDPATYTSVAAMLAGVAALACAIPVGRATRVDPAVTLRYE
jgi:putative ABC transport system permease protein